MNDKMIVNNIGEIVKSEWIKTAEYYNNVELDRCIIMPNHLHGIIEIAKNINNRATHRVAPTIQKNSIGSIIGQFKSVTTKRIHKNGLTNFKWQRNYYEHVIRNEKELNSLREYIQNNPIKWALDKKNPKNM